MMVLRPAAILDVDRGSLAGCLVVSCREAGVVVVMQIDALFRLVYLPLSLIPNCPSIAGTLLFKCKGLVAVRQVLLS
jgi:hypothetical protein